MGTSCDGFPSDPVRFCSSAMDNFNFTTLASWEDNSTASVSASLNLGITSVLIPLVYLIVCMVGLAGNSLVIYVVLCHSVNESVTNIYIFNLALADELFMLGLPFLAAQYALTYWPFGSFMCRLVMGVDAINQFTSIFCLTVMSVDRYLAVVDPEKSSKWRTAQLAKLVSAAVWVFSSVVVLPVVVFSDVPLGMATCHIQWPEPASVWRTGFIIYTTTLSFFGPLLVICLCYLLIVVKVRSSGRKVRALTAKRKRSERRVTRMVVAVVAVFVLCWLLFYVLNIINVIWPVEQTFIGIYFLVVVLPYTNSCANPIIYGFLSYRFKQGFRRAIMRPSRRVQSQEAEQLPLHQTRWNKGKKWMQKQRRSARLPRMAMAGRSVAHSVVLEEAVNTSNSLRSPSAVRNPALCTPDTYRLERDFSVPSLAVT